MKDIITSEKQSTETPIMILLGYSGFMKDIRFINTLGNACLMLKQAVEDPSNEINEGAVVFKEGTDEKSYTYNDALEYVETLEKFKHI